MRTLEKSILKGHSIDLTHPFLYYLDSYKYKTKYKFIILVIAL